MHAPAASCLDELSPATLWRGGGLSALFATGGGRVGACDAGKSALGYDGSMPEARFEQHQPISNTETVVRVWDNNFQLPRASRQLVARDPEEREAARVRIRDLSRLSHPVLPQLVAVGEADGAMHLVESWIEGDSLASLLEREGPLGLERALELLEPVLDALVVIHSTGFGHGGIDADSVMIDQAGSVRLVGLGVRAAQPSVDLADVGFLLSEVAGYPLPDEVEALISDATSERIPSAEAMLERLRTLRGEDPFGLSEDSLDFDLEVQPTLDADDLEPLSPPGDRKVLLGFAAGMILVGIMGWIGLVTASDPSEEVELGANGELAPVEDGLLVADGPSPLSAGAGPQGKWRVVEDAGRGHPTTTLVLDADNDVVDRLNQKGTPQLRVGCSGGQLSVLVAPGVPSVHAIAEESTYALYAEVSLTREGATEVQLRADLKGGDAALHLPDPGTLVQDLRDTNKVFISYAPFASKPVVATFDVRGLDTVLERLQGRCPPP